MNRKEATKKVMMISNLKNPLVSKVFINKFSALRLNIGGFTMVRQSTLYT